MRQLLGKTEALTPVAAVPTGAAGLLLSAFASTAIITEHRTSKYLLEVKLTGVGAVAADFYLWGRPASDRNWGQLGPFDGLINDPDATVSGTGTGAGVVRYFVIDDVGMLERIYIEARNGTGTPTYTGNLSEILEQRD